MRYCVIPSYFQLCCKSCAHMKPSLIHVQKTQSKKKCAKCSSQISMVSVFKCLSRRLNRHHNHRDYPRDISLEMPQAARHSLRWPKTAEKPVWSVSNYSSRLTSGKISLTRRQKFPFKLSVCISTHQLIQEDRHGLNIKQTETVFQILHSVFSVK